MHLAMERLKWQPPGNQMLSICPSCLLQDACSFVFNLKKSVLTFSKTHQNHFMGSLISPFLVVCPAPIVLTLNFSDFPWANMKHYPPLHHTSEPLRCFIILCIVWLAFIFLSLPINVLTHEFDYIRNVLTLTHVVHMCTGTSLLHGTQIAVP